MSTSFETRGERELVFTRDFAASRERLWSALTEPAELRAWLTGPPGWSMGACDFDPRPGGAFRYEWTSPDGHTMGMGGEVLEAIAPARLACTEVYDEPWYPGGAEVLQQLDEVEAGTRLGFTVRYELPEARDVALATPMKDGMTAAFERLAQLVEG